MERLTAVVTGGSNGLGAQIIQALARTRLYSTIVNVDDGEPGVLTQDDINCAMVANQASCYFLYADLADRRAFEHIDKVLAKWHPGRINLLVNCAGVNEISMLPDLEINTLQRIMMVNAFAPVMLVRQLLHRLGDGVVCNIVSNASHMPMTGSVAYNMSKAALHIATRQMARELGKTHGLTVFGVSPNKLHGTVMSEYIDQRVCETRGWTPEKAREYQLAGLPAGVETDPSSVADFIAFLCSQKSQWRYLQGCVMPFGGPSL